MNIEEPKLRETSFSDPNEDGGLGGIDSSNAKGVHNDLTARPSSRWVPNHIPNVWRQEVHMINTGHLRTNKLVGGFNHLEKYESQWEGLSHNHQPAKKQCFVYLNFALAKHLFPALACPN